MVCAEIRRDQIENLRSLLASMNLSSGLADPSNLLVPFASFSSLHMARFVIIDFKTEEDITAHGIPPQPWPATLIFLGDFDGPFELFLAELAARAEPGLNKIFSYCVGFNLESDNLLEWMKNNNKRPAANYINWVGRSVTQIHQEAALHNALKSELNDIQLSGTKFNLRDLHHSLYQFVQDQKKRNRLKLTPIPATPIDWWLKNLMHKIGVPVILLALAPLIIIALPVLIIRLRSLERSDPEITPRPDAEEVESLAQSEDLLVTNQFSAFGDVKPGLFRRSAIIFFLFMLNYASRHIYNRGFLTRVKTIHFARWVLLDDNRRVFFASNYDGDLESYMDDFINKVGWGLNLVFSNGTGWPKTRWLLKGGATYEQKFKYFLRRHQYHTNVWYKAYPNLTTVDLARNAKIRQGLANLRYRNDDEIQAWISLI